MNLSELANSNFTERFQKFFPNIVQKITELYKNYENLPKFIVNLEKTINTLYQQRPNSLIDLDKKKILKEQNWFCSNTLNGYCLYTDKFNKTIKGINDKIEYFKELGVNLIHIMPVMTCPKNENDGGYAVSDYKKVTKELGKIDDLKNLADNFHNNEIYLMLDIVLNHTSNEHLWAKKALLGNKKYQEYYYFFNSETEIEKFNQAMPEIFPEKAPGNFTFIPQLNKYVMTVFHNYQWDLNYKNPEVLLEMVKIILFYANLGVDLLRIDAPAFIWKKAGTSCQNLPQAHQLLKIIKLIVLIVAPGMALLAEAIVSPEYIMEYFGKGEPESDLAYNATQMALQWDALATTKTRIMSNSQILLNEKPQGTTWLNYLRCHDDIGLGYQNQAIEKAGFNPNDHRNFIKKFYSHQFEFSFAQGALFGVNLKNNDARICGSFASLGGLEKALLNKDHNAITLAIKRIKLMIVNCWLIGGIPMLYYGDERAMLNDYSYLKDSSKSLDNRWLHRPTINWLEDQEVDYKNEIFTFYKRIIKFRQKHKVLADSNNTHWLDFDNEHLIAFVRHKGNKKIICLLNYSSNFQYLPISSLENIVSTIYEGQELWTEKKLIDFIKNEQLEINPYQFFIFE